MRRRNGSIRAVAGSGSSVMSDSWIDWKPLIDEPSKAMPAASESTVTVPAGTVRWFMMPGRSQNRMSKTSTSLSLMYSTSSSVEENTRSSLFVVGGCCGRGRVEPSHAGATGRAGHTGHGPPARLQARDGVLPAVSALFHAALTAWPRGRPRPVRPAAGPRRSAVRRLGRRVAASRIEPTRAAASACPATGVGLGGVAGLRAAASSSTSSLSFLVAWLFTSPELPGTGRCWSGRR